MNCDLIALRKISKVYKEHKTPTYALNEVSGVIEKGTMTAVVGPSGSGKTTMLNLICGLDRPTSGDVTVLGTLLNNESEKGLAELRRTRIGLVFQADYLIDELKVCENIALPLHLVKRSHKQIEQRVADLLNLLDLTEKADSFPSEISRGQAQLVSIARALSNRPELIIADEPTANLDTEFSNRIIEILRKFRDDNGVTVIVATHDTRLLTHFDTIWRLDDGRLVDIAQTE